MAIKSLATLIKLQKSYVDEQRQQVARLQDHLDFIDRKITELEIKKAREQEAARDEATRMTYAAFLKKMVDEGRELEKQRHMAALAVVIAQEKLAELFEAQKRYEIAEERRLAEEAAEEKRRETITLDEIGSVMHERKKSD